MKTDNQSGGNRPLARVPSALVRPVAHGAGMLIGDCMKNRSGE